MGGQPPDLRSKVSAIFLPSDTGEVSAVSKILICLPSPYELHPEEKLNPKELKQ